MFLHLMGFSTPTNLTLDKMSVKNPCTVYECTAYEHVKTSVHQAQCTGI